MRTVEITVQALKEVLDVRPHDVFVLDVREPWEFEIAHIPGSFNVPLGKLQDSVGDLPQNCPIITICHHGVRSLGACLLLQKNGITDVKSLRGGIDLYARTCDATLQLY